MDEYVELAKAAIATYVKKKASLKAPETLSAEMLQLQSAIFVSIKKDGMLRGCIGTIQPCCACMAEEIIQNAISACSRDPRFPAVRKEEIQELCVSVDVLSEPEPVQSVEELNTTRFGVIVSNGYRRGLLLPNLEGVDTVQDQLMIALQKAGIWAREEYAVERFEVIRHEEGGSTWPSVFEQCV